ncbi:MAG: hypothetical protein GY853_14570 [PVC group bacterium]|nr:hypothetical protein [PVC group bacterium]
MENLEDIKSSDLYDEDRNPSSHTIIHYVAENKAEVNFLEYFKKVVQIEKERELKEKLNEVIDWRIK